MLTSKERAFLRSKASSLESIFQIGKGNITDNMVKGMDSALESRELIKVTVLKGAELDAKDYLTELAKKLKAEEVTAIGNKVVLYRRSRDEEVKHILED